MLWWSALGVLGLALVGLVSLIVLDVRSQGWRNWVRTLQGWQSTVGTVAGFLSAAGALMLSAAIQEQNEVERAERAAEAIGQALAYEVERMVFPLQLGYLEARAIDRDGADLTGACVLLLADMTESMIAETPVYDAVLGNTLDFGVFNLALFTRFYAYYDDFRRELGSRPEALCDAGPDERIDYALAVARAGLSYYQVVRESYPGVTPLQDTVLAGLEADLAAVSPAP